MKKLLENLLNDCRHYTADGLLASYIPELSKVDRNDFGISVANGAKELSFAGDHDKKFTMQSVAKPFILLLALMDSGEERVHDLVGVESTGKPFDAFNYSDLALKRDHINPMINTGAIALCTLIKGETYKDRFDRLLDLMKKVSGNESLEVDEAVFRSETETGNKNRALTYMLKAYGMIEDDAEEVLYCYFRACSIRMTADDLAKMARVLAFRGKDPVSGEQIIRPEYARYINAVLMTCGMYDGSGEFAVKVGIPAKSGVGGGIMAVVPGRMGIGLYSPALDSKGNSIAGIKALEKLSRELDLSIY